MGPKVKYSCGRGGWGDLGVRLYCNKGSQNLSCYKKGLFPTGGIYYGVTAFSHFGVILETRMMMQAPSTFFSDFHGTGEKKMVNHTLALEAYTQK